MRRVFSVGAAVGALCAAGTVQAEERPADPAADRQSFFELIDEDDPNPTNFDFSFVSVAIAQNFGLATWRGGGVYFGAGGGLGTPLFRLAKREGHDLGIDPTIEAVFGNLYFRVTPFRYLDLDLGGRLAVGQTTYDISDAPRGGFVRAGYADLRVGSAKIKFGPRFEYASTVYSDFNESSWKITPLLLRVMN